MLRKLAILALVLNAGLVSISCGPVEVTDEDSVVNDSDEANQFRKSSAGTWKSSCASYMDAGKLHWEQKSIRFDDKTARVQVSDYSNGSCTSKATSVQSYDNSVSFKDASSSSRVVLVLTSNQKSNLQPYKQTLEATLDRDGDLTTRLLAMSIWENGAEVNLSENELGYNRVTEYSR